MRHTLSYTGDNNLADAILAVEREKYKCHIRQELYDDPEAMERCRRAYEGYSAQFDRDVCMDRMEGMLRDAAATK